MTQLPQGFVWRALKLNVDTYDFEYLREWRIQGNVFDFKEFPKEHIMIVAPNQKELNDLVVEHNIEFKQLVDFENGDCDFDWEEVFQRTWKGITTEEANDFLDDFAISGNTANQMIGEDMLDKLIGKSPFMMSSDK